MGFYLNMLRENDELLGNTGFDDDMIHDSDDKYTVELKDISKTIEDINTDYADQSSQEELDGQDISANPVEENAVALYEAEYNWNIIMKAIATHEINEAARGREMVMESVDIKGFFTRIKDFFVKMFKKLTNIIMQWIANAMVAFRTNKSLVEKYGDAINPAIAMMFNSGDKVKIKGYPFAARDAKNVINSLNSIKTDNEASNTNTKNFINTISSAKELTNTDLSSASVKDAPDKIRGKFCGEDSVSASDFSSKMKQYFLGATEPKILTQKECEDMDIKSVLSNSQKDIKDIKNAYKDVKKSFNDLLSNLNKLEKAIASKDSTEISAGMMSTVTKFIAKEKETKAAVQTGVTMILRFIKIRQTQARRIANTALMAANKGARKAANKALDNKNESGFFGGLELI